MQQLAKTLLGSGQVRGKSACKDSQKQKAKDMLDELMKSTFILLILVQISFQKSLITTEELSNFVSVLKTNQVLELVVFPLQFCRQYCTTFTALHLSKRFIQGNIKVFRASLLYSNLRQVLGKYLSLCTTSVIITSLFRVLLILRSVFLSIKLQLFLSCDLC